MSIEDFAKYFEGMPPELSAEKGNERGYFKEIKQQLVIQMDEWKRMNDLSLKWSLIKLIVCFANSIRYWKLQGA